MNVLALGFIFYSIWMNKNGSNQVYANLNKFETCLENVKIIMKSGNESIGLPVLDPFVRSQMSFKINERFVSVDGLLTNFKVVGLSKYEVLYGNFQIIGFQADMRLIWPLILMNANYIVKSSADSFFPVIGKGNIVLSAHQVDCSFKIDFDLVGKYFLAAGLRSSISLEAIKFAITGLYEDDQISKALSIALTDMGPEMINDYQEMITGVVNAIILQKLNELLKTVSVMQLVKMMT